HYPRRQINIPPPPYTALQSPGLAALLFMLVGTRLIASAAKTYGELYSFEEITFFRSVLRRWTRSDRLAALLAKNRVPTLYISTHYIFSIHVAYADAK
ncbi:MAG: hypothetical protein K2K47_02030, partial [Duncaniella sp.]|nr:hypothetical protein [Duncaniella sp.]